MKQRSFWNSVGLSIVLIAITASSAMAHARLLRSNPEDGSVLEESPRVVFLWFDEPVAVEFSSIQLFDAGGQLIEAPAPSRDPSDPTLVTVPLRELPEGVYSLTWKIASDTDSHATQGALVFGVGRSVVVAARPAASIEAPPPFVEVALRALNYASFAAIVGSLLVASLILKPHRFDVAHHDTVQQARRRVWGLGIGATLSAMILASGLLMWQASVLGEGTLDELLTSRVGALWLAREIALEVCLVGLIAARREWSWGHSLAWLAVTAPAIVQALNSHAAGVPGRAAVAVLSDAMHLLASGAWVGSMLALLVGLLPLLRSNRVELAHIATRGWRRFGGIAALSVGALAATGLYNAGQQVASVDAAIGTPYGLILGGKIGLFLIAGLIGLANLLIVNPRVSAWVAIRLRRRPNGAPIPRKRLPALLLAEASCAGVVFIVSSALTAVPPARGPEFAPVEVAEKPPSSLTLSADDLLVTLSIRPNKPGLNIVSVDAVNTRRPPPAEIVNVLVQLTYRERDFGTQTLIVEPQDADTYRLNTPALSVAGAWHAQVVVRRTGMEDTVAEFEWRVESLAPAIPPRPIVISNTPLEPPLTLMAVGLSTVIGLAAIRYVRTRRGRSFRIGMENAALRLARNDVREVSLSIDEQ
jgi:copper transport protein